MAIELRQQLKLSQQLVMTPQLQQAIKLLQLNRLELMTLVGQELQENPVLEEVDVEEETPSERADETPGQEVNGEAREPAQDGADLPSPGELRGAVGTALQVRLEGRDLGRRAELAVDEGLQLGLEELTSLLAVAAHSSSTSRSRCRSRRRPRCR